MNTIECLPKDIFNICLSYLTKNELIYSDKNRWTEFSIYTVCYTAATNGWLDLLIWAQDRSFTLKKIYDWSLWLCAFAAENGHFETLKWLHKNGCPYDESVCSFAAAGGHLEILKWAKENNFPWGEGTC